MIRITERLISRHPPSDKKRSHEETFSHADILRRMEESTLR